jgi:hypothetical protein
MVLKPVQILTMLTVSLVIKPGRVVAVTRSGSLCHRRWIRQGGRRHDVTSGSGADNAVSDIIGEVVDDTTCSPIDMLGDVGVDR